MWMRFSKMATSKKKTRSTLFDFSFKKTGEPVIAPEVNSPILPPEEAELLESEEIDRSDGDVLELDDPAPSPCASDSESQSDLSEDETSQNNGEPPKKNKKTSFQESWKKDFPWLENHEDGMRCIVCIKTNKKNAMTKPGCTNRKTTTLTRNASC